VFLGTVATEFRVSSFPQSKTNFEILKTQPDFQESPSCSIRLAAIFKINPIRQSPDPPEDAVKYSLIAPFVFHEKIKSSRSLKIILLIGLLVLESL